MDEEITTRERTLKMLLMFTPKDGICPYCKKDIFQLINTDKLKEVISHCPWCNKSYVD